VRTVDTGHISLSEVLAEQVRRHLGMTGPAVDVIVPLEEMVLALGDRVPLATLSVMIERHRSGAVIAFGADGRLDLPPVRQIVRLAA